MFLLLFLLAVCILPVCILPQLAGNYTEITLSPVSRNVSLNSTVQFTCQGIGDLMTFYVHDKLASAPTIINRGFQLGSESTEEKGMLTRSLMATAYEENNNTIITCRIFGFSSPIVTSPPAVLMIQGILDGVGDLMATVINGSSVSLTWTPPYSLDNVPITGYNIITSDGINIITVNTPYHILTSSDPDPCNITTVSVGAFDGRYSNVSFFFSQVPHQIYTITKVVPFVLVDEVILSISFDLSNLCIGERPNCITIDVIYSNDIVNSTDISMISRDQLTINKIITIPGITDWRMFIINITLFNVAGERSYSIPLVRLGPVNNITSFLINCSTISVIWERPSVSDGVNIHNYTLHIIYNDDILVNKTSVNGSTTSYQFVDDKLFNHEYTYVIYGSNELGEGEYSYGTFSYPVSNTTVFKLLDDKIIHFNITFMSGCSEITCNISILCDNMEVYSNEYIITRETINISDNITITPSQYEICQLFVTVTNINGQVDSYNHYNVRLVIPLPITPTVTPFTIETIVSIILSFGVLFLLCVCICICILAVLIYRTKRSKSIDIIPVFKNTYNKTSEVSAEELN